jgi:hypothetical protein
MELDLEGLASKTFERLKRALKLHLEGTLEVGFKEIPKAGMGCGFGKTLSSLVSNFEGSHCRKRFVASCRSSGH